MILDCVIVGGGPAGLSAALMLGRCRRMAIHKSLLEDEVQAGEWHRLETEAEGPA